MNVHRRISEIMTSQVQTVSPTTLMSEVAGIFDNNSFHHLPVLDNDEIPIGIISKHDYCQLQHHFTRNGLESTEAKNRRYFNSLSVDEVMTPDPITMDKTTTILDAIDVFLDNHFHSIIITSGDRFAGIITPHDILKEVKRLALVLQ